jgi:predicted AlkP superfamily pyrophosphatase or phosphodiesterase
VHKTVVINAVGLTRSLIGEHTPHIRQFMNAGRIATIQPPLPAVTCSVQATYLTGKLPREHGVVGNGWYFRDECEIKFWRQSNRLVQAEKIWDVAKRIDPSFTCANLFWWFAMYSTADYTVTPRPMYPSDGRKLPDVWTNPPELRRELQDALGQFPLFQFWGPATSINSTRWIADASIRVDEKYNPTLSLIYLPHLDYALQKTAPHAAAIAADLRELDTECGKLFDQFTRRNARIILLSEYGITPVSRPVHLNRVLREHGLLTIRDELGHELLDPGASAAFAVADHQVAHVYVNDTSKLSRVRELVERTPGVARVYDQATKHQIGLDHPRSGELVALAEPDAWFTYYYWLEECRAPDFAHTVDIHRKPGYDPVELFLDPSIKLPKAKIGWTLLKRKLGMRSLMNVIPTDATLVKGSHGLPPRSADEAPVFIAGPDVPLAKNALDGTEVFDQILGALTGDTRRPK